MGAGWYYRIETGMVESTRLVVANIHRSDALAQVTNRGGSKPDTFAPEVHCDLTALG